jgi:ankyrin repeat protein
LVESSDDINSTDGNGLTSIGIAARTGNFEAVEVILSHRDAFVDLSTTEGHSVLLNLAQNQRTDLIDRILSGTLSPLLFDSVPLILQVWNFLFAKGLLLLWGVKIYWRSWVPRPVTHQQHCCLSHLKLLAAAHRGYLSEVRELFDSKRIDLIVAKRFATTAIHLAVASHKVDVVEYLIDHGVDIDSLGSQKMTPLHLATRANALVMVEMLLKKGASIRAKDQDGKPAWMASLHTDKGRESKKVSEYLEHYI